MTTAIEKPEVVASQQTEEDHSAGSGSYQVVARRYRPKTFDELIGQKHIAHALSNALTTGRDGQAYLFTGARGVGKTSTARIFAKSLNCVNGPTLTPCGECDSCRSISSGEDIDVIEIDAASNRGIDEIRELRQSASICPSRSRFKIYILDEVHMLTKEAFNALLKILEEPPMHIKFIFCTTEPSVLPITILSRCQRFDFAGIEPSQIVQRLASIAENEKFTADDGVFETLARRAAGSMRDAQSLLEQLFSFAPEHISLTDVHEMLGTANDQLLFRLLDAMLRCEPVKIFTELDAAASEGVDFGVMVEQMMGMLRDLLVTVSGGDASLLLFCSSPQFDQVKAVANNFGLHRILAAMQILDQTHTKMRYSTQGRVLTELALVRIAHLDHFQMISVLLDKLRDGTLPVQLPIKQPAAAPSAAPPSVKPVQRAISAPQAPSSPIPHPQTPKVSFKPSFSEGVDLETMTSEKAITIWRSVIDTIPGILATYASKSKKILFEKPNVFVAVFENGLAKDTCEKESPRLQNVLSQAVGKAVKIRFELIEKPKEQAVSVPEVNRHALFKETEDNPFIKKIKEIFGAELNDVQRR